MTDSFLTVQEIADLLKISYDSALAFVKHGGLPFVRVGRQYRVSAERLHRFLNQKDPIVVDISEKC